MPLDSEPKTLLSAFSLCDEVYMHHLHFPQIIALCDVYQRHMQRCLFLYFIFCYINFGCGSAACCFQHDLFTSRDYKSVEVE